MATRTTEWRRPANRAEDVAYRASVRAEAFEDAAKAVRFAGKTGRNLDQAAEELESFATANRQEAEYANLYYVVGEAR